MTHRSSVFVLKEEGIDSIITGACQERVLSEFRSPRNLELLGPSFQGLSPRDSTRRCQCLGASLCTPFSPLLTHHGVTRDRNVLC